MMRMMLKDPGSGNEMIVRVNPEVWNNEEGWKVYLENRDPVFITRHGKRWVAVNTSELDPDFVEAVGHSINPYS